MEFKNERDQIHEIKVITVRIEEKVKHIESDLNLLKHTIDKHYVRNSEILPIKSITYGLVAIMVSTILITIVEAFVK